MTPEIAASERSKQVREAARSWRRAGFASEAVLSRVLSLYPDDRQRFGPGFRALAFLFGGFACLVLVGLSLVLFEPRQDEEWSFAFGLWAGAFAVLTEIQRNTWKRADAGAESATAYSSVILAVTALTLTNALWGLGRWESTPVQFLATVLVVCGIAAWRWGDAVFFAAVAVSGFALLTRTGHGRGLWIVAALLLIPTCLKAAREPRLTPGRRRGAIIVGAASIVALYAAVHIASFDHHIIEFIGEEPLSLPSFLRPLSVLATALMPPALLALGWRRREPLLLYAGLLLCGISIATIRLYYAVMPLSSALILIGSACLAVALGVRRWLRSGEGGERYGFTADPLFDDTNRTEAIRSVVAVASFTPEAQPTAARPAFEGGGGSFGGGGATGSY